MLTCIIPLAPCADGQSCRHFTLKDTLTATSTSDGTEDEPKVTADPNADHADLSADAGLSDVLAPSGGEYHTHGLPFFRGLVSLSFSFSSSSLFRVIIFRFFICRIYLFQVSRGNVSVVRLFMLFVYT